MEKPDTRNTPLAHIPMHCRRVTPDQHHDLIADAAYFIAQRHGFAPGRSLQDWLEAEAEINRRFDGDYYCDA